MAFDADEKRLVAGSGDLNTDYSGRIGPAQSGQVRLWHIASETVTVVGQQSRAVLDVDISTDGQLIAAGQTDGIINVWNTGNGQLSREFYTHVDVAWGMEICFSPDSKRLAACTDDQAVKVWEVITEKEEQIYHDHGTNITTLVFSPDGKRLASGGRDHTVKLWKAAGGQSGHATMQALYANTRQSAGVTSVMFAHAGHRVFSFGASGLAAWDSLRMQQLYQVGLGDSWGRASLSPNDLFAAVPDTSKNLIRILNTSDGQPEGLISAPAPFRATFSPDGQFLAAGKGWDGPGDVKIWETQSWKELSTLHGCTNAIWDLAFSSDGHYLAAAAHLRQV